MRSFAACVTILCVLVAPTRALRADPELEYEPVGSLLCEEAESGSWWKPDRWWLLVFSGAYVQCEFQRHDVEEPETYRGRSGIEFGADAMPEPVVFTVFMVKTQPAQEREPWMLDGKFKGVDVLKKGRTVTLVSDDEDDDAPPRFRLQANLAEARGIAAGLAYLKLEPKALEPRAEGD